MKAFVAAVAFLCAFPSAHAQTYPTKPIRWLVPTGPGSALDVAARRVAPKVSEALGQPVIIENKPGGNSVVAAREAARSAPDGYTLFQGLVNNAINDALQPDPCCMLAEKFVPVTRILSTSLVMVVHPGIAASSVRDYVALAKSKPGALTYGSGGPGSITEMIGELLRLNTGAQVREIPYKAVGAEYPDLTGGHVDTAYLAPIVIRDAVNAGKLRALAVADTQRAQLAGVHRVANHDRRKVGGVDVPARQVGILGADGLVRNLAHLGAGVQPEQLADHLGDRARPAGAVGERAGLRFRERDVVLHRARRDARMHHHD